MLREHVHITYKYSSIQRLPHYTINFEARKHSGPASIYKSLKRRQDLSTLIMKGYFIFTFLLFLAISTEFVLGDCLSGRYGGPCAVWDNETCRRVCKEEGHTSGHCSASLKCWCEGC
ncbi:drosomycin-like [Anabrus simplex]|uniref:drosomycin-like n=1 Tax=Anabrus simplex TaxID=316456 RepID=UPI0035A2E005